MTVEDTKRFAATSTDNRQHSKKEEGPQQQEATAATAASASAATAGPNGDDDEVSTNGPISFQTFARSNPTRARQIITQLQEVTGTCYFNGFKRVLAYFLTFLS